MIGHDEALSIVLDQVVRLEPDACPVSLARGCVLAKTVRSAASLPPFDNAAMDGFALRVDDHGAPAGAVFAVSGIQAAGDPARGFDGEAVEVTTGACVPVGLNTIVPVEQVEVQERDDAGTVLRIRLRNAAPIRQHIRRAGEDVAPNMPIMGAGELVQPQHLMLLEALGLTHVAVTRKPRIAVICTGRELVDEPAQALESGQIRNSNGPFLAARIAAAGAQCVYRTTVGDEPDRFLAGLAQAQQARADMVLSTGAVSMGRHDFIPDVLRASGATVLFHGVRIRPGKPLLFARLSDGVPFLGLPGNPVAAAVGFRFFAEPALRAMLGMPRERPLQVPLHAAFDKRAPMSFYLKARLFADAQGGLGTTALPGQESFRIFPLVGANAWIGIPEEASEMAAGRLVDVYGLGHLQPPGIDFEMNEVIR
ncbi:MAG: molybdopterin molybdotransferase MoeA [Xanthomonadaceae bacterium]|nr:molybdopterin molybdotransferase MoeA [Xanthomonadaceae bacterium]